MKKIHCIHCNTINDNKNILCTKCNKLLHIKDHDIVEYICGEKWDEMKGNAFSKIFHFVKDLFLKYTYGILITLSVAFAGFAYLNFQDYTYKAAPRKREIFSVRENIIGCFRGERMSDGIYEEWYYKFNKDGSSTYYDVYAETNMSTPNVYAVSENGPYTINYIEEDDVYTLETGKGHFGVMNWENKDKYTVSEEFAETVLYENNRISCEDMPTDSGYIPKYIEENYPNINYDYTHRENQ